MFYFQFALSFILAVFVLEAYIHLRQQALYRIKTPPKYVSEIVSEKKFQSSQEYNYDKSRFVFVKMCFDLGMAVLFYAKVSRFYEFSHSLALWIRPQHSILHQQDMLTSAVFVLLLLAAVDAVELPFAAFKVFVVEGRHGFNKSTPSIFLGDSAKIFLLKGAIGLPVLLIYLQLVAHTGKYFPLLVWAFLFVVKLVLTTVFPTLIQPCFNRMDEIPEGKLRTEIEALSKRVGFPLKKLYIIDGSKRSAHSNAYMYGFCNNKRIVLYDTLISHCSNSQIVAILGHELGHWKMSHTLKFFAFIEVFSFFTFLVMRIFLFSKSLYTSFGFESTPILVGTILFFIVYEPIDHLRALFFNWMSRRFEFQADDFAKGLGCAKDLREGLIALERENQSGLLVDPLYSLYNRTHPPTIDRIRRLE